MKAANKPMSASARRARLCLTLWAVAGLAALATGTVTAQVAPRSQVMPAGRVGPSPKVVSRVRQPVGTPHKASSFAPHPTKRRVFGAPIQPPILSHVPPPKARKPK